MLEYPAQVLHGARVAMSAVGAPRAIVGVEDNKMDAVEALRKANGMSTDIEIQPVAAKYPQGAEKMLVKVLLGREIPSGGLAVRRRSRRIQRGHPGADRRTSCRGVRG